MAAVVIENVASAPVGTITQYSAVIGSLSKISGPQHTTLGRFLSKTANSVVGGVPAIHPLQPISRFPACVYRGSVRPSGYLRRACRNDH